MGTRPTRPSYPGMMPTMQGGMPGMMGLDKQYPMGYKPQPNLPQGQILRQQLQVRLVSLQFVDSTPGGGNELDLDTVLGVSFVSSYCLI